MSVKKCLRSGVHRRVNYSVNNGDLLVPGIINGNVFYGLQPSRGFLDDPAAILS
jgi:cobalamin biosynthesis Mg chelatase CobN